MDIGIEEGESFQIVYSKNWMPYLNGKCKSMNQQPIQCMKLPRWWKCRKHHQNWWHYPIFMIKALPNSIVDSNIDCIQFTTHRHRNRLVLIVSIHSYTEGKKRWHWKMISTPSSNKKHFSHSNSERSLRKNQFRSSKMFVQWISRPTNWIDHYSFYSLHEQWTKGDPQLRPIGNVKKERGTWSKRSCNDEIVNSLRIENELMSEMDPSIDHFNDEKERRNKSHWSIFYETISIDTMTRISKETSTI